MSCVNKWNNKHEKTEQQNQGKTLPETTFPLSLRRCLKNRHPVEQGRQ